MGAHFDVIYGVKKEGAIMSKYSPEEIARFRRAAARRYQRVGTR